MPRPKQAPSAATREGANWVTIDPDDEASCQLLAREVRDGWTGRVRRSDDEIVEDATWDGERRVWRDDDDEPIEDVVAIDLTRPAPRPRSGLDIESNRKRTTEVLTVRVPLGTKARLQAVAEREIITVGAWVAEAIEWHERRSRIKPRPGPDDLDAGNPFDRRGIVPE
jgi:hypothetical protein